MTLTDDQFECNLSKRPTTLRSGGAERTWLLSRCDRCATPYRSLSDPQTHGTAKKRKEGNRDQTRRVRLRNLQSTVLDGDVPRGKSTDMRPYLVKPQTLQNYIGSDGDKFTQLIRLWANTYLRRNGADFSINDVSFRADGGGCAKADHSSVECRVQRHPMHHWYPLRTLCTSGFHLGQSDATSLHRRLTPCRMAWSLECTPKMRQ